MGRAWVDIELACGEALDDEVGDLRVVHLRGLEEATSLADGLVERLALVGLLLVAEDEARTLGELIEVGGEGVEVAHLLGFAHQDEDLRAHHREAQGFEEYRAGIDLGTIEDTLIEVLLLGGNQFLGRKGGYLVYEEGFVSSEQVDSLGFALLERTDDLVVRGHLYYIYVLSWV